VAVVQVVLKHFGSIAVERSIVNMQIKHDMLDSVTLDIYDEIIIYQ
jgi:hypothetical protein